MLETDELSDLIFWTENEDNSSTTGEKLLHAVFSLLFLPGFTIPSSAKLFPDTTALTIALQKHLSVASHDRDTDTIGSEGVAEDTELQPINSGLIWGQGVFGDGGIVTASMKQNRVEVLRLLLVCQSSVLFQDQRQSLTGNTWVKMILLSQRRIPCRQELLYSLLNIICEFDPTTWTGSSFLSGSSSDQMLFDISLQIVITLFEVDSWINVFKQWLVNTMNSEDQTDLLYKSICRHLNYFQTSGNTYLSRTRSPVDGYEEMLILSWKLMEGNQTFLKHVLDRHDIIQLALPICYFMWSCRNSPQHSGLVHLCTFLLLLLSGERDFAVALNKPYDDQLYLDDNPVFTDSCIADLIVIVIHKLIVDGSKSLSSLYSCYCTILNNISPYVKRFSKLASTKLFSIFEKFSTPKFLFASEQNYQFVYFLMGMYSNIIQYQYEGNLSIVYSLCAGVSVVRNLVNMEFSSGSSFQKQFSTKEWFDAWKNELPSSTVLRLVDFLVPRIKSHFSESDPSTSDVSKFLSEITLVGILPVPHPIVVRKYQRNEYTSTWFATYSWGVIYLRNLNPPIWDGSKIKLFQLNKTV